MVYDALQYAEQVEKTAKKHRMAKEKAPSKAEYLSGFYATDYLIPVFTLVIYFNPDGWTGPKTLHEMFRIKDEHVLRFLPDYKINLIAPESITKEEIDKMNTDLREVLLFIKYSKDKEKLRDLVRENAHFSHIGRQAIEVINAVTNSKLKISETEGENDMCLALDEMCQDAREEGREEGRHEGIRIGREAGMKQMIEKLILEKMSDAFIMKITEVSLEELNRIKSQMS